MKKLLTSLLCVMMVVCFMPAMAWADDGDTTQSPVAQIGDTTYTDLQIAVNTAEAGQTVELIDDVEIPAGQSITVDKNITIEGNGKTVNILSDGNAYGVEGIWIKSTSGATIKNVVFEGLETLDSQECAIYIVGTGTADSPITISGCTFNGGDTLENSAGMGISTTYADTKYVHVSDCSFSNLKYGIYYNSIGDSSIKNCTFDGTKYNAINIAGDSADYPCGDVVIEGNVMKNISQANYGTDIYASAINAGANVGEITILDNTISMLNSKPAITSSESKPVTVNGGTYDVADADQIAQLLSYIPEDGTATLRLTESLNLTNGQTLDLDKNVTITAAEGKNIQLPAGSEIKINADVTFTGFNTTTAIVGYPNADNTEFGTVTVAEGKTLSISDNHSNGMNGGQLIVNGGTVVTSGNTSNGITAKVVATGGSITATDNGKRGLTLNGGSELSENTVVTATGNNTGNFENVSDLEINTNPAIDAISEVVIGAATVVADTMQGHAISSTVADREKTVTVNSEDAKITVKNPVEDESAVGAENKTSALFVTTDNDGEPTTTVESGVIVLGDTINVYGDVTEVTDVEYGQKVVNHTENPITVVDEGGNTTTVAADKATEIKKPVSVYPTIPSTPTVQKPVIEPNADVTTSLSTDGTTLTIKANDGYEITDVTVNGVSKGAVTTLTGLKTGDKIVIKTQKIETPDDNAALIEAVKNTKLIARSAMSTAKGKKAVKVSWYAEDGSDLEFDGYEVFRSLKRYSGFGTTPIFKTANEKYYNTAIKKGNKYYYKVRAYKVIDGEKVYTDWSTKAWRTVK